jgi:glycosyltransferase involved in cell wall biosynthesis
MREFIPSPAAKSPVVSVVLPTFNRLEYLRIAVESVYAQTFSEWELIIADDGSDEETRAYLRALENPPHVRIIWLSHCGIPGAVRNAALREARGEYIAFLDSDDQWMPMKLERQIAALRAHVECRWSYTGYMRIDAAGEPQSSAGYDERIRYRGAIFEHLLMNAVDIWTPAVVAERRLLAQVGGFDDDLLLFEDYDLWLRLALQSEIHLIDEPLICVRSHDQHYIAGDRAGSMLACRHRSLQNVRRFVRNRLLRSLLGRVYARSVLDLASLSARTDRLAAARLVLSGFACSWRYRQWWAVLPWVLLKLLVPRALINFYRRARSASTQPRTHPGLR